MPNLRRHPATRLPLQNFYRRGRLTNDLDWPTIPLGPSRDPGHIQHTPLYRAILDKDPYPVRG